MSEWMPFNLSDEKQFVCLECPFPEPCGTRIREDCPFYSREKAPKTKRGRPGVSQKPELDRKIAELVEMGLTDREIGERLGKAKTTIQYRRSKMGIYKKSVEDPCKKCRSRNICEERGGTCNEKARWAGAPVAVSK